MFSNIMAHTSMRFLPDHGDLCSVKLWHIPVCVSYLTMEIIMAQTSVCFLPDHGDLCSVILWHIPVCVSNLTTEICVQ